MTDAEAEERRKARIYAEEAEKVREETERERDKKEGRGCFYFLIFMGLIGLLFRWLGWRD